MIGAVPPITRHGKEVILQGIIWGALLAIVLFALGACSKTADLPPPRPDAVPVYIPVTKPCEVAPVETSRLPSADGVPHDIYGAVQRILADRAILQGDREKLKAANTDPCPETKQ